jgi:hypothetical protein
MQVVMGSLISQCRHQRLSRGTCGYLPGRQKLVRRRTYLAGLIQPPFHKEIINPVKKAAVKENKK